MALRGISIDAASQTIPSPTFTGTVTFPDGSTWTSSAITILTGISVPFVNVTSSTVPTTGLSNSSGQLVLSTSGASKWTISTPGNFLSALTTGLALINTTANATVPVFVNNRADTTTGLGGASGHATLIAGGVGVLDCTATSVTISQALTLAGGTLLATSSALTNGAAAQTGTLLNAPAAGNPTKWVPINDNGTTRYIPAW